MDTGPAEPEPVYNRNMIENPLSLALLGKFECPLGGRAAVSAGVGPLVGPRGAAREHPGLKGIKPLLPL